MENEKDINLADSLLNEENPVLVKFGKVLKYIEEGEKGDKNNE